MNAEKRGPWIPISQELLDDAARFKIWDATISPPSPLERARLDVEEAKAALEEAEEALAVAEDAYESQCITPGSDIAPPPYKMAEALGKAAAAQLSRLGDHPGSKET